MTEPFSCLPLGRNSIMEASPIDFMKIKVNIMKSLSNLPRSLHYVVRASKWKVAGNWEENDAF